MDVLFEAGSNWPTYLEDWILLSSRSSLLLFILIFHNRAAIWRNSTRISVILIYNAGFYILLAMINSCRAFSISFLCMSQKNWVCFNQSEVHLQSFILEFICNRFLQIWSSFSRLLSDVRLQIKFQSEFICIKAPFYSSFAWFSNEKEEVSSGSDFHSGASSKKFLTFYSHGEGKISFSFRFKEFWCTCTLYVYACSWKHFIFWWFQYGKKNNFNRCQSMHLVKRQKNLL